MAELYTAFAAALAKKNSAVRTTTKAKVKALRAAEFAEAVGGKAIPEAKVAAAEAAAAVKAEEDLVRPEDIVKAEKLDAELAEARAAEVAEIQWAAENAVEAIWPLRPKGPDQPEFEAKKAAVEAAFILLSRLAGVR